MAADADYQEYTKATRGFIAKMTLAEIKVALRSIESEGNETISSITHQVARYTTPKASKGNFFEKVLVPASETVLLRIQSQLDVLTIERLKKWFSIMKLERTTAKGTRRPWRRYSKSTLSAIQDSAGTMVSPS